MTTAYTTYRQMGEALEDLQNINGHSVTAHLDNEGRYIVKSYNTIILNLNVITNEYIFDNRVYSRTTGKIQNLIKEVLICRV